MTREKVGLDAVWLSQSTRKWLRTGCGQAAANRAVIIFFRVPVAEIPFFVNVCFADFCTDEQWLTIV